MSMIALLLTVFAILAAVQAQQTVSGIPLSRNGYNYLAGNFDSSISVDLVIDLGCSATRDAWDVLSAVVHEYSDTVKFQIKILPLPYHQFSFLVSKAASAVYFYEGDREAFKFMNAAITNQPDIYNSATADKTYNDIKGMVKGWATNATSITDREFEEAFDSSTTSGNTIEMFTRMEFKTAAINSFYGTPMYAIQGLKVSGLDTLAEWKEALDPLVAKPKQIESDTSTIYL